MAKHMQQPIVEFGTARMYVSEWANGDMQIELGSKRLDEGTVVSVHAGSAVKRYGKWTGMTIMTESLDATAITDLGRAMIAAADIMKTR